MKVAIVTPFFNVNPDVSRPGFLRDILVEKPIVFTSDYSHQLKSKVDVEVDGIVYIKTIKYKSNVSFMRFLSHFFLSLGLASAAIKRKDEIDIFYITAPFSIVVPLVKVFTNKKIIVDIIDFWPLSLPFPKNNFLKLLLLVWERVNVYSISFADKVISQSSEFLRNAKEPKDCEQVCLSARKLDVTRCDFDGVLRIVYIGNIGMLYDFESLISAINNTSTNVEFHLIGSGDRKDWLINALDENNIQYKYHGNVYEKEKLKSIFSICHLAFNGYKDTNASFSYKSVSYFQHGLPIINSMKGDLWGFVNDFQLGVNYEDVSDVVRFLDSINNDKLINMVGNTRVFFEEYLEYDKVKRQILSIFEDTL